MIIGNAIGIPFGRGRGVTGLDAYKSQMAFWSDGTIEDGKLKNLLGDQDMSPSLVDSNCLDMAIDDTITYADLSGWSIVSKGGTAVIEIDGNTVKCTTAGTLYNLVLSDGTNQHTYPLAEGGYTIAFDVSDSPVHGVISAGWTTQDEYHKNVEGYKIRDSVLIFEQSEFTDSGDGTPVGWYDRRACGVTYSVNDNIVRVAANESTASNFCISVWKNNVLTVGKTYTAKVRMRANRNVSNGRIYFGTAISYHSLTTEWQTITSGSIEANNVYFGLAWPNTTFSEEDWIEFDYVHVYEPVAEEFYVPKRSADNLTVWGEAPDVIGSGNFIECETKLQFPDIIMYQDLDRYLNLEYFYDRKGDRRKLAWNDLHANAWGLDMVFNGKEDSILKSIIVVDPQLFNRSQFRSFIRTMGLNDYPYQPIINGALIYYRINRTLRLSHIQTVMNNRGCTVIGNIGGSLDDASGEEIITIKESIELGNHWIGRIHPINGQVSFEISSAEETEFATEIASGDLILVDAPADKTGAIVKCDWPDFATVGTLTTVSKVSGTAEVGDAVVGYANVFWIPAGQSGVPAAFEEKPLYRMPTGIVEAARMRYYEWYADDFFGATFTNSDDIQVYVIEDTDYYTLWSEAGIRCVFKHIRNVFEDADIDAVIRVRGFLESHGLMVHASVATKPLYDAGFVFGSNGRTIYSTRNTVFNNQDDLREWCAYFGHNLWRTVGRETIINTNIPAMATKNEIRETDFIGWDDNTADDFDEIIAVCDANGVLFMSPVDLVKNMQFNDYDVNDFWKT